MIVYEPVKNIVGFSWKTSKTDKGQYKKRAQKLKIFYSHC
jgi:hypothetical protein